MLNLDYWNTFVGEESPEAFMRNFGSADPELCVSRFLEERGQLYGVVNQSSWVKTFAMPEQHQCLTVKVYLLSYLDETRDEWSPALEANPAHTPRRYREKFDPDRFPPPGVSGEEPGAEEAGTYGTYIPDLEHDLGETEGAPSFSVMETQFEAEAQSALALEEYDPESPVVTPDFTEVEEELVHRVGDPAVADVVVPDTEPMPEELDKGQE